MQSSIIGTTMPVLEFVLDPNESIISEAGELSWMSVDPDDNAHAVGRRRRNIRRASSGLQAAERFS